MLRLRIPLPRLIGPGEVIAGEGALATLQSLPATRVALVASARAGDDAVLMRWLELPRTFELRQFRPSWIDEPDLSALRGTLAEIVHFRPDWIVAVGGGSTIDGARLCWALYEHPHFALERLRRPFSLPPLRALARFVAVPTTSGTGAECSSASVLSDRETGRKIPVVTHDFLPDVVILEPRLTLGLPSNLTVLTALDALAHALEGRVSTLANPLVDELAENSAASILKALLERELSGDSLLLRSKLQVAAYYAGQVQNLRLVGLAHAVAHQLGHWNIPHSAAVGALLQLSIKRASRLAPVQVIYDKIARRSGLRDTGEMINAIGRLQRNVGVSGRLGEMTKIPASLPTADAVRIADDALADPIARFLPYKMERDELARTIQEAW